VQVDEKADALEQLYRERYTIFRDVLAGIVGSHDSARDVVQEAFARALRERRRFRGLVMTGGRSLLVPSSLA